MHTEPMTIDGLAGPVVVDTNVITGKNAVTVGGVAVSGTRRRYLLPTVDGGTVAATVRGSLLDPYPVIEIDGVRHRTGPSIPVVLRLLTVLPLALIVGGLLGGVFGGIGVVANLTVARRARSTVVAALLMIAVLAAAATAYLIVAALLLT